MGFGQMAGVKDIFYFLIVMDILCPRNFYDLKKIQDDFYDLLSDLDGYFITIRTPNKTRIYWIGRMVNAVRRLNNEPKPQTNRSKEI